MVYSLITIWELGKPIVLDVLQPSLWQLAWTTGGALLDTDQRTGPSLSGLTPTGITLVEYEVSHLDPYVENLIP